ncbi:MAG: DUF3667 domain-containing protein [Caulobacteraceae bacterium]
MAQEIEAAAVDSVHPALGRHAPGHALPVGAPCPNCATPLAGPWCHACGQPAEDYHRSLVKLSREAIDGLFDLDGRLWRTLPDLCLRPARLTRAFLDGHRIGQIPPFRLFLIVVVLVFLAAGFQPQGRPVVHVNGPGGDLNTGEGLDLKVVPVRDAAAAVWVTNRLKQASKDPKAFEATLTEWAQRLAVLALPLSAGLLGLMFFWRRGIYLFDHLIFSMHSLSFQGLLLSTTMLTSLISGWFQLLFLIAPVHLFAHLKGTYGLGLFGTLWRMAILFAGSVVMLLLALSGLVIIGLTEIGG